ncbi:MAG TPA: S1C family serine protease [Steroidobacteraceae bacterium]|nr:S1C family serine protease [Steroidobacteraceae bacterium]
MSFPSGPQASGEIGESVLKLRAVVPQDAFTAGVLGVERVGSGVVIASDGLVLTIGYLITEASDVWLTLNDEREVAGHPLAYDQVTGFGLVVPLEPLGRPPLPFGNSEQLLEGSRCQVVSCPEFAPPETVRVLARREFAGAWEYLLENAIFTVPAHSHWSGAALVDEHGALVGLGSLLVREIIGGKETNVNMFVPIDQLKPILEDMVTLGRAPRASRPWLGLYAVEIGGRVLVTGVAEGGPAQRADLREGDVITHLGGQPIEALPQLYRTLWAFGSAGVSVPLTLMRSNARVNLEVRSVDRTEMLKRPVRH